MVGDPGIEPGVGRPGRVTVSCRTLQLVAHCAVRLLKGAGGVKGGSWGRQACFRLASGRGPASRSGLDFRGYGDEIGREETDLGGGQGTWRAA